MMIKTILAGFGGQGVLMMGYSLANAGMIQGYHVTYLPSYGAEVRGGTANCTVAIADEEIASPVASAPDYLLALNAPSLFAFQNKVVLRGGIFINSSIVRENPTRKDVDCFKVPASEIAETLGEPRAVNVIMLGAYLKKTGLISADAYLKSLKQIMGERRKAVMEINKKAFMAGQDLF